MASPQHDSIIKLIHKISQSESSYETWQILRLMKLLFAGDNEAESSKLYFQTGNYLRYPKHDIKKITFNEEKNTIHLIVNYMGLTGISGIMPLYITELLSKKKRLKDTLLQSMLDCIQQRSHQFYYQAWEKSRIYIHHENSLLKKNSPNPINHVLQSLIQPSITSSENKQTKTKFAFIPLFASQTRTVHGLQQLLETYLLFSVSIEEFSKHRVKLPSDEITYIGSNRNVNNNVLGVNFTAGTFIDMDTYHFTVLVRLNISDLDNYRIYRHDWETQARELITWYLGNNYSYNIKYKFSGQKKQYLARDFYLYP